MTPWPGRPSSRFVGKDLGDGPPDLLVSSSDLRHRARRRVEKSAWADGRTISTARTVTSAPKVVINDNEPLGNVGLRLTGTPLKLRVLAPKLRPEHAGETFRPPAAFLSFFRDLPLKRKLTVITMVTSGVAMLLACLVFVAHEQVSFRQRVVRDLLIVAEMTGENVTKGLAFNDVAAVEQTLGSLRVHPRIMTACVYDPAGRVFAKYRREGLSRDFSPPLVQANQTQFGAHHLDLFTGIERAGERVGTLYIRSDLSEARERIWRYVISVSAVLVVCSAVAYLMASRLQRLISRPIADLARTVAIVATQRNYSIRAVKQSEDEIGRLIDGFNEMLTQIQQRDSALQAARNHLEIRVDQRTMELANSLSLFNATLNSTADGILALNFSGEIVCANSKFETMWGLPTDVREKMNAEEVTAFNSAQVKNSEAYGKPLQLGEIPPESEAFDVVELKDGRSFERYIKPQRIHDETVGLVINFRDITERRRAEEELKKVHERLIETSRLAGMAEVATGVLHNVGNVLNSVNVGATCMADKLQRSRVPNLAKVVALMAEHPGDLGRYLTQDTKGKQVPAYLAQLAEHLAGEKAIAFEELSLLQKNIEHIKEIVAMQQNYAKISGVVEMVEVGELVEDALRLNAGALVRHDVETVREFTPVPPITVEKHKVLQILVNLIRNAKYACDEAEILEKRMIVRVETGEDCVKVSVSDNGVGISPENLTRIFGHGFTTRKEGHGFGLHSGGLSAKEMGGALTVWSAGAGQGATFTLTLPLLPPQRSA